MAISTTMQRYAAEIYRLQQDHPFASLSMISDEVHNSLQAVSRMIQRMKRAGLLEHEPYRGVRLTPRGEKAALRAIRRHRLAEVFLVKVMNFGWEEAHDLTDTLEKGIDDDIEDRMDALAGHPTHCPHGDPIPSRDGVMPVLTDRSLITLEAGMMGHIARIRTREADKLRYLAQNGLVPGVGFRFLGRGPFNGPIRIQVEHQEIVLGHELATIIWVDTPEEPSRLNLCSRTGCPLPRATSSYGYVSRSSSS